jgi:periplasmic protein CpxP/Spy
MNTEDKTMTRIYKILTRVLVMFSVVALTPFANIALANEGGGGGEHSCKHHEWGAEHYEHHFKKLVEKLGLTDAQQAQAKAIFEANKAIVKPLKESLHAEKKILHALLQADQFDEAALRAQSAKLAPIYTDLVVNKAKVCSQFRAILTPAQAATLKALHEEHKKKCDAKPATPANPTYK